MRTCKVPGCNEKHEGLGYCNTHYGQFHRTGKVWKIDSRWGYNKFTDEQKQHLRESVSKAHWKGGRRIDVDGYVRLHIYDQGSNTNGRDVYEHRLVMEKHLGRKLDVTEIVHHLDLDKQNNKIENLMIVTRAEHFAIHKDERHKRKIQSAC